MSEVKKPEKTYKFSIYRVLESAVASAIGMAIVFFFAYVVVGVYNLSVKDAERVKVISDLTEQVVKQQTEINSLKQEDMRLKKAMVEGDKVVIQEIMLQFESSGNSSQNTKVTEGPELPPSKGNHGREEEALKYRYQMQQQQIFDE